MNFGLLLPGKIKLQAPAVAGVDRISPALLGRI